MFTKALARKTPPREKQEEVGPPPLQWAMLGTERSATVEGGQVVRVDRPPADTDTQTWAAHVASGGGPRNLRGPLLGSVSSSGEAQTSTHITPQTY